MHNYKPTLDYFDLKPNATPHHKKDVSANTACPYSPFSVDNTVADANKVNNIM